MKTKPEPVVEYFMVFTPEVKPPMAMFQLEDEAIEYQSKKHPKGKVEKFALVMEY